MTVGRNRNNTVNNDVYVFTIDPVTFAFEPVSNAEPGVMIYSQPITIQDLPHSVEIIIDNGEYSVNGQAFTQQKGLLVDGDSIQIRLVSSPVYDESVVATVTINGASENFVVTTTGAPVTPSSPSLGNDDNVVSDNTASFSALFLFVVFLLRLVLTVLCPYSGCRFNTILRR